VRNWKEKAQYNRENGASERERNEGTEDAVIAASKGIVKFAKWVEQFPSSEARSFIPGRTADHPSNER
jgi:hypothetical protein